MFSYEGYRQTSGNSTLYLVPTPAQLNGDFSGQSRRIYNPFTTRADPANPQNYLRDPFPNNMIPASLINPATHAWAQAIIPAPVNTGNPAFNGRNTTSQTYPADNYSIRVDHNFTSNDFLWARYTWGEQNQRTAACCRERPYRRTSQARMPGPATPMFLARTLCLTRCLAIAD
jgi:hypothetical protein